MIDVEKTSVSQEVTPSEVEELPLLGRDAANLAYLVPGVKQADSFDPTKAPRHNKLTNYFNVGMTE